MSKPEAAKIFRQTNGTYSYTVGALPPGVKFITTMLISTTDPVERAKDLDELYRRVVGLNLGWQAKVHQRLHDLSLRGHRVQTAAVGMLSLILRRFT